MVDIWLNMVYYGCIGGKIKTVKRLDKEKMTDGELLSYMLSMSGLTVKVAAGLAKVGTTTITRFKNNEVKPNSKTWFRIMDLIDHIEEELGKNDIF